MRRSGVESLLGDIPKGLSRIVRAIKSHEPQFERQVGLMQSAWVSILPRHEGVLGQPGAAFGPLAQEGRVYSRVFMVRACHCTGASILKNSQIKYVEKIKEISACDEKLQKNNVYGARRLVLKRGGADEVSVSNRLSEFLDSPYTTPRVISVVSVRV